ncbi:MAG: response regulator transcription factor [Bacteroidales bacterium]|nr:response regulator transcription factor [Bacteroidales bacterium]
MIAQGLSSKDIAEKLGITFNTVETHRKNMLKKLNINTTAELIFISTSKGWLKLV